MHSTTSAAKERMKTRITQLVEREFLFSEGYDNDPINLINVTKRPVKAQTLIRKIADKVNN